MRNLTASERRTIRIAAIAITIYLVGFVGFQVWKFADKRRSAYAKMVAEAQQLKNDIIPYADKAAIVQKLMEDFHMDPARLSTNSTVAEATAAIQKAAMSGGIQPGPIRESAGQASNKNLATIQFEGTGNVAAVMSLLQQLPTLGYPLMVDSVQIASDPRRPGQMKLNLSILVLDFSSWKTKEPPHA